MPTPEHSKSMDLIEKQAQAYAEQSINHLLISADFQRKVDSHKLDLERITSLLKEQIITTIIDYTPSLANIIRINDSETANQTLIHLQDICLAIYRQLAQQLVNNQILFQISRTDQLTRLQNRYTMDEQISLNIERATRYGDTFSYIITDLDHFKAINDTYGHQVGDIVLSEIARRIREEAGLRRLDVACRYGGEEISIILPKTDIQGAMIVASRISKAIADRPVTYATKQNIEIQAIPVTASIGISEYQGVEKDPTGELIVREADESLYFLKHNINTLTGKSLRGGISYQGRLIPLTEIDNLKEQLETSGKRSSLPPPSRK